MRASRREGEMEPIASVKTTAQDQVPLRAGETFKADRVLRATFMIDSSFGTAITVFINYDATLVIIFVLTNNR